MARSESWNDREKTSHVLFYYSSILARRIRGLSQEWYIKNGTKKSPFPISVIHVCACIDNGHTESLKPTTSKDIFNRSLHIPTSRKQSPHILRRVGESHFLQLLEIKHQIRSIIRIYKKTHLELHLKPLLRRPSIRRCRRHRRRTTKPA